MKKYLLIISALVFLSSASGLAAEFDQDTATQNLSEVLKQQRMVPNRDPNTDEVNGYRVLDMQEAGFTEVGLLPMDVIKDVNGGPVDSVQKAMELYNSVKIKNIELHSFQ